MLYDMKTQQTEPMNPSEQFCPNETVFGREAKSARATFVFMIATVNAIVADTANAPLAHDEERCWKDFANPRK